MNRIVSLIGATAFLLSSLALHSQVEIQPTDFIYNAYIQRGEIITLRYNGDVPLQTLSITLRNSDGDRIQSTSGFLYRDRNGRFSWIAMLGAPSTIPADKYMLTIAMNGSSVTDTITLNLDVLDRPFAREIIPLTTRLTNIRTDSDPEKAEQSRIYAELLNSVSVNAVFSSGILHVPTDSQRITSMFGNRRVYQYSDDSEGRAVHNGIDYGAPTGTIVRAAAAGLVRMARERITTGNTIVLEHLPGVMTAYFHLDSMFINAGGIVRHGERIGTIGATGLATGAHLHWELRVGGVAVDPVPYLTHTLLDTRR